MKWKNTTRWVPQGIVALFLIAGVGYAEINGIPADSRVRGKWKLLKQTPKQSALNNSKTYKTMSRELMAAQLKSSGMSDADIAETLDSMEVEGKPDRDITTYEFDMNKLTIKTTSEGSSVSEDHYFRVVGNELQLLGPESTAELKQLLPDEKFQRLQKLLAMRKTNPHHLIFKTIELLEACTAKSYKVAIADNGNRLLMKSGPIPAYDNQSVRYDFVRADKKPQIAK